LGRADISLWDGVAGAGGDPSKSVPFMLSAAGETYVGTVPGADRSGA
jgi:hypothetical protein